MEMSHSFLLTVMPPNRRRQSTDTSIWNEGCHRCEVHQCVVVGVEAVVQTDEAVVGALSHAVVAGYYEVHASPEAGSLQL